MNNNSRKGIYDYMIFSLHKSSNPEAFPAFKHLKLLAMSLTENKLEPSHIPLFESDKIFTCRLNYLPD